MDKYDALISKGFSKDNIVSISSHAGANVAINTILANHEALTLQEGILSMSSGIGANQAIETAANKYYAV